MDRPVTFIKEGRPQARTAGVAHRGDSRFRPGKVNWRFAPTKCKFFWAARFGRGPDSENSEKHCVFSHPNLNSKRSRPFSPLLKKRFLEGQRGSGALVSVHQNAARWWGELTIGWVSRPRAITFRRKNCVAAAQASESTVKNVVWTHGGHMVAHVVSGRAK